MDQKIESIKGYIDKVTYWSEDTGFIVVQVIDEKENEITLTTNGTRLNEGESIKAKGSWIENKEYGKQFQACDIATSYPETPESIKKFLGSGLIKGIGRHYAGILTEKYGKNIFRILDKEPSRLLALKGFGESKLEKIQKSWKEHKAIKDIVLNFGKELTATKALKIYKEYGKHSVNKIKENPYQLVEDIKGIGFKQADLIAQNLYISKCSENRINAGILHVLNEIQKDGHCAFPYEDLIKKAAYLLDISQKLVAQSVNGMINGGKLIKTKLLDNQEYVYLDIIYNIEKEITQKLLFLNENEPPCKDVDAQDYIDKFESENDFKLAPEQADAIKMTVKNNVLVITGGPGVGKTTITKLILNIYSDNNQRAHLCAPTGRAAKRLSESTESEASTIHRLLEFDPFSGRFKYGAKSKLRGEVFIVDESSMLDLFLANALIKALPEHAVLIFIGDKDQLPSVGPGNVLKDIIESKKIPVCKLEKIFRQEKGSNIALNAQRINCGRLPDYPRAKVNEPSTTDFYFIESNKPENALNVIKKLIKESVPNKFGFNPLTEIQVLSPMYKGVIGVESLNKEIQKILNPKGLFIKKFNSIYRVNDKVMQTVNNYEKNVFNGDIGKIKHIDTEQEELTIIYDESEVQYGFDELDEITHAYAITIHKSQGSEYPVVIIPVHSQHYVMLQRNLIYTAVTRGKKLVILVGNKPGLIQSVRRNDTKNRFTGLKQFLLNNAKVESIVP